MVSKAKPDLIEFLTLRGPFLLLTHACAITGLSLSSVRRILGELVQDAYLGKTLITYCPLPDPVGPLLSTVTHPEDPDAAMGPLAYQGRQRSAASYVSAIAFYALPKAAKHFGGYAGSPPRKAEGTHNAFGVQVYVSYMRNHRELIASWVDERSITHNRPRGQRGLPTPDYLVKVGETYRAVEILGQYSAARLRHLWAWCTEHNYQLEVW